MSSKFYASIIEEDEQEIDGNALKNASRVISIHHRIKPKNKGLASPDYNNPAHRCAYLYKYATLHTGLVTKYFRKMIKKKHLQVKKNVKICCLGGGPGTDIVGIFKVLAVFPYFQKRITKVSVLDICQGWEVTFDNIISNLIDGKEDGVPDSFFNQRKFTKEFIQVDLLNPLPDDVEEVISEADVICMTKFVSELPKERAISALTALGKLFKQKALILFIDNFQGDSFESVDCISRQPEFEVVLGPLVEEKYFRQSRSNIAMYGCKPQTIIMVSVIGWIKTEESYSQPIMSPSDSYSSLNDDALATESDKSLTDIDTSLSEGVSNDWKEMVSDKFTHTEERDSLAIERDTKSESNSGAVSPVSNDDRKEDDWGEYTTQWYSQTNQVCCSTLKDFDVCDQFTQTKHDSCSRLKEIAVCDQFTQTKQDYSSRLKEIVVCDKFTQTKQDYCNRLSMDRTLEQSQVEEFPTLIASTDGLLTQIEKFVQKENIQKSCCSHHTNLENYHTSSFENKITPLSSEVELSVLTSALGDLLSVMEKFATKKKI